LASTQINSHQSEIAVN